MLLMLVLSEEERLTHTADLTKVITSIATTITTDHLTTLSKLDPTHMTTFASDGVANMDNFAARVDVTSAMLGSSIDTIDTTNLSTVVEHLHASLDGDSLTALKSLEKTHMSHFLLVSTLPHHLMHQH